MKNFLTALCATGAALLAATSFAALPHTENFESLEAGTLDISASGDEGRLWTYNVSESSESEKDDTFAVVKAYKDESATVPENPKGGNKYLAVDTSVPLQRNVQGDGAPLDVGAGLYFEGDVKFTPYDAETAVTADTGDKLLVYLSGSETKEEEQAKEGGTTETVTIPGVTNFVIKAGYYNGRNVATEHSYTCAVPTDFNTEQWHHLVVKAKIRSNSDGTSPRVFFEIAVDGEYLTSSENKGDAGSLAENVAESLFPSLDTTTDDVGKLASIGFKGQGFIDNITWTNSDPAPVSMTVKYVWNEAEGSLEVKVNGAVVAINNGEAHEFKESDEIVETFTPADGYVYDGNTSTTVDGVITKTFKAAKAGVYLTIDAISEYVKDLAAAVAKLSKETSEVTVKLLANETMGTDVDVDFTDVAPNAVLDLNGFTLTLKGLYGATLTINGVGVIAATSEIYADNLTIKGGKFSKKPDSDNLVLPDGKKLGEVGGYWELVDAGSEPEKPSVSGGTGTVEGSTIKITAPADDGTVTIEGDASSYTVEVPANVTTIKGKVKGVTVKSGTVDISGAFKTTKSDDTTTTIALNPDGSVTVNGKEIKVKPELEEATETVVPFAVAGGAATAKVKAIPGLAYVLKASTDVTKMAGATPVGEWVVAGDSGTVELKDSKASESTKFYVIEVTQ